MKGKNLSNLARRILIVLSAFLLSLGVQSCMEQEPPMVKASKSIIRTGCEAQSIPVTITSNAEWTATSDSQWLTLSREKGTQSQELDLILDACDASQERLAIVTIKTVGKNVATTTISVSQSAKNSVLQISPSSVEIGNKAQEVRFAVASNTEWTVTSTSAWAVPTATQGSGNQVVTVNVAANDSHSEDRVAKIVVLSGNDVERVEAEFVITQLSRPMASLTLTQSEVSFAANAKSAGENQVVIPVITNITGEINVVSDFAWCNASYQNGAVTIAVEDNTDNAARTAIVNVYADVDGEIVIKQVLVTQAGVGAPELLVLKTNVVAPSFSGDVAAPETTVAVPYYPLRGGIKVKVADAYPTWISDVKVDATTNQVTFVVAENKSSEAREGVVTIIAELGNQVATYPISVTQQGVGALKVVVSSEQLTIGAAGGELETYITTPVAQSTMKVYVADATWATAEIETTGDAYGVSGMVTVKVSENTSSEQRSATVIVVVSVGDQLQYVPVSVLQDGIGGPEVITVSSEIVLPQAGCKEEDHQHVVLLGVDDQTTVKAIETATWLEVIVGKDYVGFVASTNESSTSRSTVVTILSSKGGEESLQTITVIQPGTGSAELLVEGTSYEYPQAGGNFKIAIKSVNGTEYKVVDQPVWVSLKAATDFDGMEINVEENLTTLARSGKIVLLSNNGDDYRYYTIAVTQLGLDAPAIELSASEIVIPRVGLEGTEGYEVSVIGADDYTTVSTKSSVPWLEGIVSAEKDAISIKAEENAKSSKREGEISVIAVRGGQEQIEVIKVIQPGTGSAELRISVDSYEFGPKEVSVFEIPVTKLNGSSYSVAAKPEWVSVVAASEGSEVLKIGLSSNESTVESREGVIILRATNGGDETQYSISIKQLGVDGPNVTLAVSTITVPIEGIDGTDGTSGYNVGIIGVDEGTTLSTRTSAPWVQGVITADKELSFVVTDNSSSSKKRTAVVSVVAAKGGEEQILSVEVVQPGTGSAALFIPLTEYSFAYTAVTDFVIPVTKLNGSKYTIAAQPEWLTIKAESVGTEALVISMDEHKSNDPRTGTVVLRATNGDDQTQYTIKITQLGLDGPNVKFDRESIVIPIRAITKADGYYVAMIGADANTKLTVMQSSVAGDQWFSGVIEDNKVYIEASENTKSAKRSGQLTVLAQRGEQEQILTVEVIQPGTGSAALEIARTEYVFSWRAISLYEIPIIRLNGTQWTIDAQPEWIVTYNWGGDHLNMHFDHNDNVESREGDIVIRATNGDDETIYVIHIKQLGTEGPDLQLSQYDIVLPQEGATGNNHSIAIINYDPMVTTTIHNSESWFSGHIVHPDAIFFHADPNPNSDKREGTVTIRAERGEEYQIITINVVQLGTGSAGLEIPIANYTVGAPEHNDFYVSLTPLNGSVYTVDAQPTWVTNMNATPYGLTFDILSNEASTETRTGNIILRVTNGDDETQYVISLTQLGVDAPNVTLPAYDYTVADVQTNPLYIPAIGVDDNTSLVKGPIVDASWLTVTYETSGTYENFFKVVAAENAVSEDRETIVTAVFARGGEEQIITFKVTQVGKGNPYITSDNIEYVVGSAAGELEIPFETNTTDLDYMMRGEVGLVSGGTVTFSGNKAILKYTQNPGSTERTQLLQLYAYKGDRTCVFTTVIRQLPYELPEIVLSTDKIVAPCDETEIDVKVFGLADLLALDPSVKQYIAYNEYSWIDVSRSSDVLKIKISENTAKDKRSEIVYLTVRINNQVARYPIEVVQYGTGGPNLAIATTELEFTAAGYTDFALPIIAKNGTTYTVKEAPSWVTATPQTDHLEIDVPNYELVDPREGDIVLEATLGSETLLYRIDVKQNGVQAPNVIADLYNVVLGKEAQTDVNPVHLLNVTTGVQLSAPISSSTWLSATLSGTTVTFTATENTSAKPRKGIVTIIASIGTYQQAININVTQLGNGGVNVLLDETQKFYTANAYIGEEVAILIDPAEVVVTVVSTPSWVKNATISGDKLTYDVEANTSADQRTGTIILKAVNGSESQFYTIQIVQMGAEGPEAYLMVDSIELPFTASTFTGDVPDDWSKVGIIPVKVVAGTAEFLSNSSILPLKVSDDLTGMPASAKPDVEYVVWVAATSDNVTDYDMNHTVTIKVEKNGQEMYLPVKVTQLHSYDEL